MTAWPLVKLVDAPEPDARVRLDLNSAERWGTPGTYVDAAEFSLGYPLLDGDPTAVGSSYSYRTLGGTVWIGGSKAEALSVQAALWRELARPASWLMFQLTLQTPPVWARIYRAQSDAPLSLDQVDASGRQPDAWRIPLTLTADAFLYGERITHDPVTVTQTPTGDYPMRVVLPAIKGDAPTGLRVTFAPDITLNAGPGCAWLVGCLSGDASPAGEVVDIGTADGFTAQNGTGAPVSNAAYFGGEYRALVVAMDSGLLPRLTGQWNPPLGRYTVYLRYEIAAPVADETVLFRLQAQGPAGYQPTTATAIPVSALSTVTTTQGWVSLGDVSAPGGQAPLPDDAGFTTASVNFSLEVGTVSGAAVGGKIDAFLLIPVDAPSGLTTETLSLPSGSQALVGGVVQTLDADTGVSWSTDGSVLLGIPAVVGETGGYPFADPARVLNVLYVVALNKGATDTAPSITTLGAEADVTVSYHPRYLQLPGEAATP